MGKDVLLKRYLYDNERFADLLNGFVGEELVKPESLTELDTQTGLFSELRNRFGRNKRQRYRDLLKKAAFGINFLVVGIENQESVHYLMPLRCMSYDAGEYERQAAHIKKKVCLTVSGYRRSRKSSENWWQMIRHMRHWMKTRMM